MKMKALNIAIIMIILCFSAYAQQDFSLNANSEMNLCPCSNQGYPIFINNDAGFSKDFKVSFGGSAAKFVNAVPSEFTVEAGANSYFYVYVNSPCNIVGKTDLEIYVTDSLAKSKGIRQSLIFSECYQYDLFSGEAIEVKSGQDKLSYVEFAGVYELCEREEKFIPVLIVNKERYDNNYVLTLDGEEWGKLSTKKVSLLGESRGIVLIEAAPPEGSEGEYELLFESITELGEVEESLPLKINVEKCYGLELEIDESENIFCLDDEVIELTVRNTGSKTEVVNVSTNQEFARINKTIIVNGDSEEKVGIALQRDDEVAGAYDLVVSGGVVGTDIKASDNFEITVEKASICFEPEITLDSEIKNFYSEEYHSFFITNKGLKTSTYEFKVDGPKWVEITPKKVELKPDEERNINLHVNPPEETQTGNYMVNIEIATEGVTYNEELNVLLKEENKFIKSIKDFFRFYQYYFYLGLVFIIILLLLIRPISKWYSKWKKKQAIKKEKKEKERQKLEEKRRKQEERERLLEEKRKAREEEKQKKALAKEKEEKKKQEKKREEKIATEKKKAEKVTKTKKGKGFFKRNWIWMLVILILIIGGVALYAAAKLGYLPPEFVSLLSTSLQGVWAYSYYIFVALVFLGLIILFFNSVEKDNGNKRNKKGSKKKKGKKTSVTRSKKVSERRSKKRKGKFPFFKVILWIIIIGVISYLIYLFNGVLIGFLMAYWLYIVIGFVVLFIVIVALNMREEK